MCKLRISLVSFILILLLLPSITIYAEEITPCSKVGIVVIDTGAPLFNAMDINIDMVTAIPVNTSVQITGVCDGWYQVLVGEEIFYIPSGFLSLDETDTDKEETTSEEVNNPIYQDSVEYYFNSVEEGTRCLADAMTKHATYVRLKTSDIMMGFEFVNTFGALGNYNNERTSATANWVYNNRTGDRYMENNQYVYIIDAIIFYHDSVAEAQYVDQVVASMIPEIISQGSVYNQIKYVHDFICNLVEYDGERINVNGYDEYKYDSSYNCLVDRKAVCTGYSLLFQKFMEQLGIPSFVLANDVHMWNTVNYDGVWYLMDVTWDDTDQGIIYDYFLSGLDWNHQSVTNLPLSQIKHIFF